MLAAVLNGVLVGSLQTRRRHAADRGARPQLGLGDPAGDPGAVLSVVRGGALIGQSMLINRIGNGVVGDIQGQLLGNFVRGDLARLRATHSGGFVSQILFDASLVREAATAGVLNYVQNGLTLVGHARRDVLDGLAADRGRAGRRAVRRLGAARLLQAHHQGRHRAPWRRARR